MKASHSHAPKERPDAASAISLRALRKVYGAPGGGKEALRGMDLDIPRGAFFGLLGPNGAGKSTLINILAGLTVKTSGTALINGYDIERDMRQARLSIGVVPQELALDTFFTVREALDIHAGYYGVPRHKRRTEQIIAAMGLADKADARSRTLSGGMRRRLLIAKALAHQPPVLILDEPTAGVDVELRGQLWDYVRELNRNGATILLTTHYLEEAEALCDRIAIIHGGALVACDHKETLLRGFDSKQLLLRFRDPPAAVREREEEGWQWLEDGRLSIRYQPSRANLEAILARVRALGLVMDDITTRETELADIFLHLTARKAG